jgi:Fe-S cluster biosynthesis and repair protein YggX
MNTNTSNATIFCQKLKQDLPAMQFAPLPGPLGKRLQESVSAQAWQEWLKHQTMLINENRLNMSDKRSREYLARQLDNYFFGTGTADQVSGYVPE